MGPRAGLDPDRWMFAIWKGNVDSLGIHPDRPIAHNIVPCVWSGRKSGTARRPLKNDFYNLEFGLKCEKFVSLSVKLWNLMFVWIWDWVEADVRLILTVGHIAASWRQLDGCCCVFCCEILHSNAREQANSHPEVFLRLPEALYGKPMSLPTAVCTPRCRTLISAHFQARLSFWLHFVM